MGLFPYSRLLLSTAKCYANGRVNFVNLKFSVRNLVSKQLVYCEFGDPLQVVKYRECPVRELGDQEVLVRMLAAPINPADINTIQGKYPVKVELPCIPGNEGVGIVEEIGPNVQGVSKGNKVIVTKPVQGTWRDIAEFKTDVLRVVPDELGTVEAATLTVNPCTAYRMLSDFQPVKEQGLVVIQNGANSACGQNVIQICKAWGVPTVNIVRNRPDIAELKKYLQDLGATYVLTEEELRHTPIFKDKKLDRPALALNCVGGKSSSEMLRHLHHSGKMVTYGGMSREPVIIPTSAFIFKNISFYGYWMTAWNEKANVADKDKMMSDIITLMCTNKLKGPAHKMVKFDQYKEVLGNALTVKGFTGCITPMLPCLPHIPGDEGVGEIVEVGKHVGRVKNGQRVIISSRSLGTWRYYGIYHERQVHVVAPNLPLPEASMLAIAPCTAYRMLKDFYPVSHGQTVIQNGANSPCGQSVIQLCRIWGINTINIVANLCNYEATKQHLLSLGATCVLTLEEAEGLSIFDTSLSRPVLGLNCLGGRYEQVMYNLLQANGAMVYYGCAQSLPMLNEHCQTNLSFYRFYIPEWECKASCKEKETMIREITQLMVIGKFKAPQYEPVELKNYIQAFKNTASCDAFSICNYVFDFTLPP